MRDNSSLTAKSSYVMCAQNTTANSNIENNNAVKYISLLGYPTADNYVDRQYLSNPSGALVGRSDTDSYIDISNVCYLNDGTSLVGDDDDSGIKESNAFAYSFDDMESGRVCYILNESINFNELPEGDTRNPVFGQVINDFTKGSKDYFPKVGSDATVYKDLLGQTGSKYTNYDPRKIETQKIEFEKNHSTTEPDISSIGIKTGDDYVFTVKPDSGYSIDSVEAVGDDNKIEVLEPTSVSGSSNTYKLSNIKQNYTIIIYTNLLTEKKPLGTGRIGDPYLIYNAQELLWFNNHMKETVNLTAQVKLMADIDYSAFKWTPLYSEQDGGGFAGVFDGNGHTISGISLERDGDSPTALFRGVQGSSSSDGTYDWVYASTQNTVNGVDDELSEKNIDDLLENNSNMYIVVNPNSATHSGAYIHNTYIKALLKGRIIDSYTDANGNTVNIDSDQKVMDAVKYLKSKSENSNFTYVGFVDTSSYNTLTTNKDYMAGYSDFHIVKQLKAESGVIKNLTVNGTFGDAGIAYMAKDAKFINVKVQGKVSATSTIGISQGDEFGGGLVAVGTGNLLFDGCTNEAKFSYSTYKIDNWQAFGGILGKYANQMKIGASTDVRSDGYNLTITNCKNTGYLTGNSNNSDNMGNTE